MMSTQSRTSGLNPPRIGSFDPTWLRCRLAPVFKFALLPVLLYLGTGEPVQAQAGSNSAIAPPAGTTTHPRWRILVLIYPTTDFSYVDRSGISRRVVAQMTIDQMTLAAGAARRFFGTDVPALTSGNMVPVPTVRYVRRTLSDLQPFCNYTPTQVSVAPELDPTFDSIVVIWASAGTDVTTGEQVDLNHCGAETIPGGTGQTFSMFPIRSISADQRNVFKHEWGHAITFYFEATGAAPKPAVNNHINDTDTRYINCITGESYILQDETDDNPIPNSIYHNHSGFTHDYYSGLTATPDQPTRCLGITPEAWASPPPSQWRSQSQ